MRLSREKRQELQGIVEKSMENTADNSAEREFLLFILELLRDFEELNQKEDLRELASSCQRRDGLCFHKTMQVLLDGFANLELPPEIDDQYVRQFTRLADNLSRLSFNVNKLRDQLERLLASRKFRLEQMVISNMQ